MLYDFTVKTLSVPALSTSNKVLQAIKWPRDQLSSWWCLWMFPFDAYRTETSLVSYCKEHFNTTSHIRYLVWATESGGYIGTENSTLVKGKNIPRQEEIYVKFGLKATFAFRVLDVFFLTSPGLFPSEANNVLYPHAQTLVPSPDGKARAEDQLRSAVVRNRLRSKHIMTLETGELPLPTLNNSLGDDPVCS